MVRVAAVMTCHNRRDKTLACLESLEAQDVSGVDIDVVVVDDGSTDGTGAAVRGRFPQATVIEGDGDLLWAPGMRIGLEHAAASDYDYYLWLNDDVRLDPDALSTLLATAHTVTGAAGGNEPVIVVGAMRDPDTGVHTYGGRTRLSRLRRTRFSLVPPADHPQEVETFNGNVVLVPRAVATRIGHVDPAYRHSWADEDYGLRARAAGMSVWQAPGTVGTCARNPQPVFGRRPLRQELRELWGMRLFFPSDWATFTRRWAGPAWPVFRWMPYVRHLARVLPAHVRARLKPT